MLDKMLETFKPGKRATVSGVLTVEQMCEDFNRITRGRSSAFGIGTYHLFKDDGSNFYARVCIKKNDAELKIDKSGNTLLEACMALHKELRFMGLL